MPFPDELDPSGVRVVAYRPAWAEEAEALGARLSTEVPAALGVEHIGSTSIPGMSAKDCLDMMIVVADLADSAAEARLGPLGYRVRPEPWNRTERAAGRDWPKLVFAPPIGARAQNIHVRTADSGSRRLALLFRDHLRAHPDRTRRWSELKTEAAAMAPDLAAYGRIKAPAWHLLMELAETWARESGWEPPHV